MTCPQTFADACSESLAQETWLVTLFATTIGADVTRKSSAVTTKANLTLVELFLNAMKAKVAAVEIDHDHFRVITTEGGTLNSETSLDAELEEFRKRRG